MFFSYQRPKYTSGSENTIFKKQTKLFGLTVLVLFKLLIADTFICIESFLDNGTAIDIIDDSSCVVIEPS